MNNILNWQLFIESYNKPRAGGKRRWSIKYKKKINCSNPKGFSQKQYCKRKRRGGAYKNESVNDGFIKSTLEDIFLEITDIIKEVNWIVHVDSYSDSLDTNNYEVYISFGSSTPWQEGDMEDYVIDYGKVIKTPVELVDSMKRAIDFMSGQGYDYRMKFHYEYSDDPGEDLVENIDIDELDSFKFMRENESIRILFSK